MPAFAALPAAADLPLTPTAPVYNFAGQTGLLDMPTARFQADGEMSATVSSMHVQDRYSLGFQALPWLETTFRYSRIDRYLEPKQGDLYDRSLGFKIRLVQETDFWPNVAVGAQDILGTGAEGAEYFVTSKKFGPFDATLGIGWRRFSGFSSFDNPLGALFPSFKNTDSSISTGTPLLNQFFHGPNAGLFGGLEWQTPIEGLRLLMEVSGDDYGRQERKGAISVRTPLNFGFSYEPWNGLQVGAGYLYGSAFGFRVTLHANPFDPEPAQRLGEPPTPAKVRTPDDRQAAVLDVLQDTTHYYDNWTAKLGVAAQMSASDGKPVSFPPRAQTMLVDAVFRDMDDAQMQLASAETYGGSLIFDVKGRAPLSCESFSNIGDAVRQAGFSEVVLTSGNDVKICDAAVQKSAVPGSAVAVAADPVDAPQVPEGGEVSTADLLSKKGDTLKTRILELASAQGLFIQSIEISPTRIDLAYSNGFYHDEPEAVGRLLRILMSEAPPSVETFRLVSIAGYLPTLGWTFQRSAIERAYMNDGSAAELLPVTGMESVGKSDPVVEAHTELKFPRFSWGIAPGLHQSYFDPVNPYNFALYASVGGSVALTPDLAIAANVEANIYTTFTKDTRKSNSLLPHVRSDFVSYYQKGKNGIASLMALYTTKLSPDVYLQAKAGYLESMYAGVGGEILWQPPHQRWALGAALYDVKQRSFDRLFGFRDYSVVTGHLAAYYSSPIYGLDFALYAGRYLAGDYGATLEIRRHFDNGIEIGAYATLTNVPFNVFGEGSFDKGFIIRIPVDFLAPVNSQKEIVLDFTPLTRDGGQRLDGEQTLFYAIRRSSERGMLENWNDVLRP